MRSKPVRRILVATDFSECSAAAWEEALATAAENGAKLLVVHTYGLPRTLQSAGVSAKQYDEWEKKTRAAADAKMDRLLAQARRRNVEVDHQILCDLPDHAILESASDFQADLLVLGTHGRRGLTRFLLGSVASSVLARAKCPVLVVRASAGARPRSMSA